MAIFDSYVKLPEGTLCSDDHLLVITGKKTGMIHSINGVLYGFVSSYNW
jgi:hypothetical protein